MRDTGTFSKEHGAASCSPGQAFEAGLACARCIVRRPCRRDGSRGDGAALVRIRHRRASVWRRLWRCTTMSIMPCS